MVELEEDSLIASYSRNRSKWQSDSSKFTPRGILPRETKPVQAATTDQVTSISESKPVEIEDKSIILNYHINRSRWQSDSSKFTPKGILPIDSSPLIGRRSITDSSNKESNRAAESLNDDRSVFSASNTRDGPTETELPRSTANNPSLLRNGENTELVESLDIVPQYSFYAEYFGQDESVKSSQNLECDDVLDYKSDIDSPYGAKGRLRPSNIASVVNTSEDGEWNKLIPLKQQKIGKESSSSSVKNNTVDYHRIFAERTEERNRPISIVARGRSKTPPTTKGVRTIDEHETSKENILQYVDDTLREKKLTPSSPEAQTRQKISETQQHQAHRQEDLPTISMKKTAQEIKSEDDTPQCDELELGYPEEVSQSKTATTGTENELLVCKSANNGCYLQTNNLETLSYLLPNSMEDYAAYPESPFEPCLNEQENNQDITSIQDRSPEIHTTQKDVLIATESPTKNLVEENVLQLDGQFAVENKATYSPTNCKYLAFSKSSDDEPIFIEESDFHSTDEDSDQSDYSMRDIDELGALPTKLRGSCETSPLRKWREDIDRLNIVENESHFGVHSSRHVGETSPISKKTEEVSAGAFNMTNFEEINEVSSVPVVEHSIDHLDSGNDSLHHHAAQNFYQELIIEGTTEILERDLMYAKPSRFGKCDVDVPPIDLNGSIEKLDCFGRTSMTSTNEEDFEKSHDYEEDNFIRDTSMMEATLNKQWKVDKQKEEYDANIALQSTAENDLINGNPPKKNNSVDRDKIPESKLQKSIWEKDGLFDTDVVLCDATTVSSFTDDENPFKSREPNELAPELHSSKQHPQSVEGSNIELSFSKNPSLKAHLKKSNVQSSESEHSLGNKENRYTKNGSHLKEHMVKLNENCHLQPLSDEKHPARLKLKTNVYAASPGIVSRNKFQLLKATSSQITKGEQKTDLLHRSYTTRMKGEADFLLAELLAVSASKIVLADDSKYEDALKKVVRPDLSSAHAAIVDAIDAPMDEMNSNIKCSQSRLSHSVAEEDVTISKCVDEMKQFWDWAAKFAKEENSIPYFSPLHATSKSGHALVAEEVIWDPFGGGPELDRCVPMLFQNEAKFTQSKASHSIDRSVKAGENATDVSIIQKNNSLLPTSLANAIQQTYSKREAAKSNIIVLSGGILARTSFKNIFMKKWKKSFWIQFEAKLMLFRSMEDFKDWKCCHIVHTSDAARTKNANQHDSLVKFRIDFLEEMSRPGMRGFRATEVKSKIYDKGGPLM